MNIHGHKHFRAAMGFTLVELLVSMGVITLMMALVVQLINGASRVIGSSGKHMDADTEERLLFNRLSVDLRRIVKRADLDYSSFKQPTGTLGTQYNSATIQQNLQTGGNDQMAFYAETEGFFSGATQPTGYQKAPASLVAYMVATDAYTNQPCLRRMGKGLGWDPDSGGSWLNVGYLPLTLVGQWSDLFSTSANGQTVDADYQTVGSQVVRFEYTYLLKPNLNDPSGMVYAGKLSPTPYWSNTNGMASSATAAHTSVNGFQDVAAIVVTIAVLDSTSRAIVSNYTNLTSNALFVDAQDAATDSTYKGDLAPTWNAVITNANFATKAGIPPSAAAGVRVYERSFYLDTTP